MMKKLAFVVVGCAVSAVIAWAGAQRMLVDSRVSDAGRLVDEERWREARLVLRNALWWRPDHPRGNLLMAESLIVDPLLSPPGDFESDMQAVGLALDFLSRVPEQSPEYAESRFRTAFILFYSRRAPGQALRTLDELIERFPDNVEALTLRFQILAMVGRAPEARNDVLHAAELVSDESRARLLRDWYLYEFYHYGRSKEQDVRLGVLAPGEETGDSVLPKRYRMFRSLEPESSLGYVALARWFQQHSDPETAQQMLDEALAQSQDAESDPLLYAVAVAALDDLGRIAEAAPLLEKWPGDKDDFEYWRAKAIHSHRVDGDLAAAEEAYRKALERWPGQINWGVRNMLAACLREAGKTDEAVAQAERAALVERLMHDDVQDRVFVAVGRLDDPEALKVVVKYYRDLELPREADAWQSVVDWLESSVAPGTAEGSAPSPDQGL
ncbi:MAG TPA: tetratricopeptide repeat protein [Pirellulaceae bacterium]|nr:tetratricopeptide repeat protein [Pirellulaceae bacterium]